MYNVTKFQAFSLFSTSFLPLLFWTFPRFAVQYSGVDAQWAVLGVCLLGLYAAFIHGWLNHRFQGVSGVKYHQLAFGKFVGKTITILYIPGYILFITVSLMSFSLVLKSVLPSTPRGVTIAALCVVAVIGARHGLETLAGFASLAFPVLMGVLVISSMFPLLHGNWIHVFYHPANLGYTMNGVVRLFPIFLGMSFFVMINPYYDHTKRSSIRLSLLSVIIASITIVGVYISCITSLGYEGVGTFTHPTEFVLQLTQVKGVLIEKFGVVFIFLVTMFEAVFLSNHLWALSETIYQTFDIPKKNRTSFVIPIAVVILVTFLLIPNQQVWDFLVNDILFPLSWIYIIIEPSTVLLIDLITNRSAKVASSQ